MVTVVAVALAASAPARADERPQVADIGGRATLALTDQGMYGLAGLSGLYYPHPHVALGGYVDGSLMEQGWADQCTYNAWGCPHTAWRIGAMGRVDVLPMSVLDPWVGLGLGTFWVYSSDVEYGPAGEETRKKLHGRGEVEGSVGLDVRVPHVSFGPYGFTLLSLDPKAPGFGGLGLGLRGAARF